MQNSSNERPSCLVSKSFDNDVVIGCFCRRFPKIVIWKALLLMDLILSFVALEMYDSAEAKREEMFHMFYRLFF